MHVNKKIIYVSHDAHFHGAQLLSLHTIKALKENFDYSVAIISIGSGILIPDFQKYGPVYCLEQGYQTEEKVELLIKDLLSQDFTLAICSTVISGDIVALLARHNIKVVSLIHELPHLIQQYSAEGKAKNIAEFAYKVVFLHNTYMKNFVQSLNWILKNVTFSLKVCLTTILIKTISQKLEMSYVRNLTCL